MIGHGAIYTHQTHIGSKSQTRWTFFRVKLVFEYDFEISWSFGLWNPWTFRPRECQFFYLFPPPPPPHTSSYLLPLGLVWYGLVWGGCQMTSEFICEEISMLFHSSSYLLLSLPHTLLLWYGLVMVVTSSRYRSLRFEIDLEI